MDIKPLVSVENLVKEFRVARRGEGLKGAIKYLFSRQYDLVKAVDGLSFQIFPGEIVGYIGRNGAGKSTTIKMLTGILTPTRGKVEVNGLVPYRKRPENARQIGVVFGQRTQLKWDIPVIETFRFLKEVYEIPEATYQENLTLFSEILSLNEFLARPVRKLSLGQRMRCDLAASFLHNPRLVYLDEPTIGLDIIAKERIREFIKAINRERQTTILLTTHDLEDIEDLCRRTIIIDRGKIVYDGDLKTVKEKFSRYKLLTFEVKERLPDEACLPAFPPGMELHDLQEHRLKIRLHRETLSASEAIRYMLDRYDVLDISLEEPGIETVVKKIYQDEPD
jgi:ABC-2 type transport system ATP-binding protein